jgi:CheY-like chemotaxis protein
MESEALRLQGVRLEAENRQIQEANRLKSEFLANMSHELRTPLNAVIGFADILRSSLLPADSPKRAEYLGHIAAGGRHLLQIINDVLDLAKVESGKFELFPEVVDLPRLVGEVTGVLQAEAAHKHLTLEVALDPALTGLVLDVARLKQVLYNFLSNAIKFTGAHGRVVLRAVAEDDEGWWRLEVEDNGVGISPADQARLFTPFQQANTGPDKQHGGTGLGLALTRQLVELQGGSVGLRSELGAGSVFHARLPRVLKMAAPLAQPGPADSGAPHVLVVEDDLAEQQRLAQALAGAGCRVDLAVSVQQAIERLSGTRYDAVTLDLLLGRRSGLEVLARLREDGPHREVPVIVVTAVTESSPALAGFDVHAVLHKPVDGQALVAALRRAGMTGMTGMTGGLRHAVTEGGE